jgi:hypothetical protein
MTIVRTWCATTGTQTGRGCVGTAFDAAVTAGKTPKTVTVTYKDAAAAAANEKRRISSGKAAALARTLPLSG